MTFRTLLITTALVAVVGCASEPTETPAAPTETVSVPAAPTTDEPPAAQPPVVCADNETLFDVYVTDTDTGCRPTTCAIDGEDEFSSRTDNGYCATPVVTEAPEPEPAAPAPEPAAPAPEPVVAPEPVPVVTDAPSEPAPAPEEPPFPEPAPEPVVTDPVDRELTEEEAAALAEQGPIPYSEYGLEGCTEVSAGICEDADGVMHCNDVVSGWSECPGQHVTGQTDACPVVEPSDRFAFTGRFQTTGQIPLVLMAEGRWRIDACLRGNDLTTGEPGTFYVSLFTPPNDEGRGKGGVLFDEEAVVDGEWSTEIDLVWGEHEPLPFEVLVTPGGHGLWTLHITRVDG